MKTPFGLEIAETLKEFVDPRRCALIVYDMQVGILRQIEHAEALGGQVRKVLDAARKSGMRVFFTRHLSLPKQVMGSSQFRMGMAWQRVTDPDAVQPWFLRDSPGFQVSPDLEPLPSEAILDKLAMSAFEGTPLTMALRDCRIQHFAIVGVATEIGIDITCRHGADLGFAPILIRDACGSGHQAAADRAIETLDFLGDTVLTDVQSFLDALLPNAPE
jgi:biuret amidohydrolase